MYKHLLTPLLLLSMLWTASPSVAADGDSQPTSHGMVLPGTAHIDVEQLNRHIDLTLDVDQLNLNEVRVLRNAFAARQGYPFRDAYLRGVFMTTSWYSDAMWKRYEKTDEAWDSMPPSGDSTLSYRDEYYRVDQRVPLSYSKAELAFIEKLRQRETQLLRHNFTTTDGQRVNMANVVNASQLLTFPQQLSNRLGRNGFAIVPADHEQLFQVYEKNDYAAFPNFVTTDLYLQLFHLYFDCLLREVEQHRLFAMVEELCAGARQQMAALAATAGKNKALAQAADFGQAYFAIAQALLSGGPLTPTATTFDGEAQQELSRIRRCENALSPFLGQLNATFEYSLFRPRGHYTKNDTLSRYFQAMMWLQTAPFGTDQPDQLRRAVAIATAIAGNERLTTLYNQVAEPLTYLMGQPDNVSFMQVAREVSLTGQPLDRLLKSKKALAALARRLDAIAWQQTRLRPKYLRSSFNKLCLMPQRYMPDAEVLQEMVDYDSRPSLRPVPGGVDVMAAMRWSAAEQLLASSSQYAADRQWPLLMPTLERMQHRLDSIQWSQTMATSWMSTLLTLSQVDSQAPYFMHTSEWQLKSLNTALASWAELKHDAILYAKQPMGAECGGAGPPAPVVKGYVEPNTLFWQRADSLLNATTSILSRYGLLTERSAGQAERLREEAQFLLAISHKELQGQTISEEEYDQLRYIGATFENLSLDMLRQPDQYLMGWDDVQGTDRNLALIADVYTANADNNPSKSVVYAGVGQADELYVVVEVGGYLYLMRGAVFSYREMKRPYGEQRLTDEEWQQQLQTQPRLGVPQWMEPIVAPLDSAPLPNDEFFYSSGC